jgi:CRP-like cAMP-binding protein
MGLRATEPRSDFWSKLPANVAAELRMACLTLHYAKGEAVFREQDPYRGVFLIESGCFQWHRTGEDGTDGVIKIYGPGEIAGVAPLFDTADDVRYIATLTTLQPGRALFWPAQRFLRVLQKNPEWMFIFSGHVMRTLKEVAISKATTTSLPVRSRLEDYLQTLGAESEWVSLPMHKHQIARALNTSAESISRALACLLREGRLRVCDGRYFLVQSKLPNQT